MKHLVVEKATMDRIIKTSSITSSNSGDSTKDTDEEMASKVHPYSFHTVVCKILRPCLYATVHGVKLGLSRI